MTFMTPSFWYRRPGSEAGLQEKILLPFSKLYQIGHKINQKFQRSHKIDIPVICIGNIVAGGSGKTPVALAVAKLVKDENLANHAFFLTRGYGGDEPGPTLVDLKKHKAEHIGDESLMLAGHLPTIVSRNRFEGALLAMEKGADLIIMDDGLQNRGLIKDISLVVVDGTSGFGNKNILPAGPLRESLQDGFAKAGAFLIIGEDRRDIRSTLPADKPVFGGHIAVPQQHVPDKNKRYIAFAGIGTPVKFKRGLESLGLELAAWHPFADHYYYNKVDIDYLKEQAKELDAQLITTEKDYKRLGKLAKKIDVTVLPIELTWDDRDAVRDLLAKTIRKDMA